METKIIEKDAFKLIGMERKLRMAEIPVVIPQMWMQFMSRVGEIKNRVDLKTSFGLYEMDKMNEEWDVDSEFDIDEEFTAFTGVEVTNFDMVPDKMVTRSIKKHKYAVFTHSGNIKDLPKSYDFIYKEWYPTSGYKFAAPFDFELYDERFNYENPSKSEIDIYLPIKDKVSI